MSGTSNSSPHSWIPLNASAMMLAPVPSATVPRIALVTPGDQTRKP